MDHTRDNPLKRFTAFWIAIALISVFGLASLFISPLAARGESEAYQIKMEERLDLKRGTLAQQEAKVAEMNVEENSALYLKEMGVKPTASGMAVPAAPVAAPLADQTPAAETQADGSSTAAPVAD